MKILAIHSAHDTVHHQHQKPVDIWRVQRPIRELRKNMPDWIIREQQQFVQSFDQFSHKEDYRPEELEAAAKVLGAYDIVFSSYFWNPTYYVLMKVVHDRYGTEFVLDIDDNMFAINEDNPVWTKITHEQVFQMQQIIRDCSWITTTTPELMTALHDRRRDNHRIDSIGIMPNYIPDDYVQPTFDNGDKVVIGFFGGSSHFADLNDTGFRKAVRDIMRKYRHVNLVTLGVPIDLGLSKSRYTYYDGVRGSKWVTEMWPKLNLDISVCPLEDNSFNHTKSNIKWQESTRLGAAVVASNIGPYKPLLNFRDAVLVQNTRASWFSALEYLVTRPERRRELVNTAQEELARNWRLEDHWQVYRDFFQKVKSHSLAN